MNFSPILLVLVYHISWGICEQNVKKLSNDIPTKMELMNLAEILNELNFSISQLLK